MNLVSIIVPAYNSRETVGRCIDSLLGQTYENIEILIVDDGSTDDTPDICREYEGKSKKVNYFYAEHSGVSGVRNLGLEKVTGDYVMFVDADDYVKEYYVEKMVNSMQADNDCDMCVCSYLRVIYNRFYPIKSLSKAGLVSRDQYLIKTLRDPGHHYFGVLWNKIFKSRIIKEHGIRFRSEITLGEDFVFSLEYLKYAKSVNVIDDKLYYYCYQEKSTLSRIHEKSLSDCESEMANRNQIYDKYTEVMKYAGLFDKKKKRINHYWIVFYLRQKYDLKMLYKWSHEDKNTLLRDMLGNENIKEALRTYKRPEIAAEYTIYCMTQTGKNILKQIVKFIRNGKR